MMIELVFEPDCGSECGLGNVLISHAEIEALVAHPVVGKAVTMTVPAGTVRLQERRYYQGPPSWGPPRPPRITLPGTVVIRGGLVEVVQMMRVVVDGKVSWGGYFADVPNVNVQTPFVSIDTLRAALEPYPVEEDGATAWREVAKSDVSRAAVLLREGADDALALDPDDLLLLLTAEERNVREVARSVLSRTRRSP